MTEPTTEQQQTANPTDDVKPDGQQGEPGFKPITSEAELSAWKDGVRKSIAADVRKQLQDDQAAKDAEAEETRKRDEEVKRGEFDKVRTDLENKLTAAETDKQALAQKVEKYEALATKQVDTLKGDLPAEAVEDFPADADPVAQLEWLEARKALVAKLAPAAQNGNGRPRVPATPRPSEPITQEATSLVSRHAI